jgi:hypothetical protein
MSTKWLTIKTYLLLKQKDISVYMRASPYEYARESSAKKESRLRAALRHSTRINSSLSRRL